MLCVSWAVRWGPTTAEFLEGAMSCWIVVMAMHVDALPVLLIGAFKSHDQSQFKRRGFSTTGGRRSMSRNLPRSLRREHRHGLNARGGMTNELMTRSESIDQNRDLWVSTNHVILCWVMSWKPGSRFHPAPWFISQSDGVWLCAGFVVDQCCNLLKRCASLLVMSCLRLVVSHLQVYCEFWI